MRTQVPEPVERYSVDDLLVRDADIRVMTPSLRYEAVHWHDFYELGMVVDGAARHVVNGVEEMLEPGSVFLLSPADFHEIDTRSVAPLRCYNVVIDPRVVERQLDDLLPPGAEWVPWAAHGFGDAAADFGRLEREAGETRPGAALMREALVRCLLVELWRRCGDGQSGSRAPAAGPGEEIRRAVRFVERHFREPVTLADAAAVAHLSPNYFSQRFRAFTGLSFQTYLQHRRLQFAHSLLASGDLSVAEVCHAAGFNSSSYFGRAFQRRFGVPPSSVRRPRTAASGARRSG